MTIASFVAVLNDHRLGELFLMWLAWSLKGTVLLFVAWLFTLALRGGSAAVRHLVWASGLAGMLLLPAFARVVPTIHAGWLEDLWSSVSSVRTPGHPAARGASAEPADRASPEAAQATVGIALSPGQFPVVPRSNSPAESSASIRDLEFNVSNARMATPRLSLLAAALWLVVMGLLLMRALAGVLQLSMWSRRAEAVHDAEWLSLTQRLARGMQIGRPVTLLQSPRACVPMTWGVVYPRILLPADADSWLSGRRTIVLLHELAHIKRLDTLTQLLAQVSTALFWFHPAVWFVAREMRREREHACDDSVLDAGARASDYAHSLLQIARPLVSGAPAAAALAMARKSELEGRLLAILDPRIDRRPASRLRLAGASVALVALAVPLAAVSPSHAAPSRGTEPATAARPAATLETMDSLINAERPATRRSVAVNTLSHQVTPLPDTASRVVSASVAAHTADVPPPAVVRERPAWTRLDVAPPVVAKRVPDVETLIAVTRAATKMTSDHEKAEVLLSVARHYVPDNELRSAYFDAVLSMHNDFDRTRSLEPVLMKDSLTAAASQQLLRIAAAMSSDNARGTLVMHLANSHPSLTPSMRSALISMAGALHSDFERTRCIAAIVRRGSLSTDEAVRLIGVAKSMTSSTDKANALLAIAGSRTLDTAEVRRAYIAAAETITSAFDYRRVIVRVIE